jgi:hypothetical protein
MSGTMIERPSQGTGHVGAGVGAAQGAATGAAAGAVAGPVGMVVGGVIGGIAGAIGGMFNDSSDRHRNLAYKWASMGKDRQAAVQRRDVVRKFRMQRAQQLVAGSAEEGSTRSSSMQGSTGALTGQFGFGINYFDTQALIAQKYAKQTNKAGKDAATAGNIFGMIDAAGSIFSSAYGAFNQPTAGGELEDITVTAERIPVK